MNWLGLVTILGIFICCRTYANTDNQETRKAYLEDIFIWKMSDELKLSAKEEKVFSEIQKSLNERKSELNKKIQDSATTLSNSLAEPEAKLKSILDQHRRLLADYNKISIDEFDQTRKLLGTAKMAQFIHIKQDLATKLKAVFIKEKSDDKESNPSKDNNVPQLKK